MFQKQLLFACLIFLVGVSCKKKSEDTPLALVSERLEISPKAFSILKDQTKQFDLRYFNNVGLEAALPTGITWTSSNLLAATVTKTGLVTGLGNGQAQIIATYKDAFASALITVVSDENQLAILEINSGASIELRLNETDTLKASGKTINGSLFTSALNISWRSATPSIVEVDQNGRVTAKAYGTSSVWASASDIESAPLMVQVIRTGTYTGQGSRGTAKLKIENNTLKLQTSADFVASSSPPDLRMYLSQNSNNVNDGLELVSLNQRSGAQSWNVPAGVSITQYRYAVIWCKQVSAFYGSADLGN